MRSNLIQHLQTIGSRTLYTAIQLSIYKSHEPSSLTRCFLFGTLDSRGLSRFVSLTHCNANLTAASHEEK